MEHNAAYHLNVGHGMMDNRGDVAGRRAERARGQALVQGQPVRGQGLIQGQPVRGQGLVQDQPVQGQIVQGQVVGLTNDRTRNQIGSYSSARRGTESVNDGPSAYSVLSQRCHPINPKPLDAERLKVTLVERRSIFIALCVFNVLFSFGTYRRNSHC